MHPVRPCRVTQPFADPGNYASRSDVHGAAGHHTGIDYGSAWPIPIHLRRVRAILPGEVVISEYNSTMGNWVGVYNHEHDLLVTYWHMASRRVNVGDWVLAFERLGRVGNTGNSTAAHLHLQVNRGRFFDYHGHIDPKHATNKIARDVARKQFKANRTKTHPEER